MSDLEYYNTQLDQIAQRLSMCKFVLISRPNDCDSARTNVREFIKQDLNELHTDLRGHGGRRLQDHERTQLVDRINTLQLLRSNMMELAR